MARPRTRRYTDQDVLTVAEVAAVLRIPLRSAYRLAATPGFPVVRLTARAYRVPWAGLQAWLAAQAQAQRVASSSPAQEVTHA